MHLSHSWRWTGTWWQQKQAVATVGTNTKLPVSLCFLFTLPDSPSFLFPHAFYFTLPVFLCFQLHTSCFPMLPTSHFLFPHASWLPKLPVSPRFLPLHTSCFPMLFPSSHFLFLHAFIWNHFLPDWRIHYSLSLLCFSFHVDLWLGYFSGSLALGKLWTPIGSLGSSAIGSCLKEESFPVQGSLYIPRWAGT